MTQADPGSSVPPVSQLVKYPWAYRDLFYVYQKLEVASSFRLLRIEPPNDANSVSHYSIIQTTLDQAPAYETLSYVWGTNDQDEIVTLKDGKFLRITKPLKEALPVVEKQCKTGYLWIDQICIDQDDMIERGHQVKLMGQIYTKCSRVLVWLGWTTAFDDEHCYADNLAQCQSSKATRVPRIPTVNQLVHGLRKVMRPGGSSKRSSRLRVLQSEWFQRAWVFQEIVLPPSAMFIQATISTPHQVRTFSLPELHDKVNREPTGPEGADPVIDTISDMYRRSSEQRRKNSDPHWPIEETLSRLAPRAKTAEELDRLYAFFGLNFNTNINLKPSYDSSLEEAMMDTAISIIEGTCSLDIFEVIPRAVEKTKHKDIPTWTPDFREERLVIPFKPSNIDFREHAHYSHDLCPKFITDHYTYFRTTHLGQIYCAGEKKRMVQAQGFVLDHVHTKIGSILPQTAVGTPLYTLLQSSINAWSKTSSFAPKPTFERLSQALIAEGYYAQSYDPLLPCPSDITEDTESITPIMKMVMHGRTLWMTKSGRFALGSYLRSGDPICLVYGCSNPIALRREGNAMKVLGTCFLEGWMDPWSNDGVARAKKEHYEEVFYMI